LAFGAEKVRGQRARRVVIASRKVIKHAVQMSITAVFRMIGRADFSHTQKLCKYRHQSSTAHISSQTISITLIFAAFTSESSIIIILPQLPSHFAPISAISCYHPSYQSMPKGVKIPTALRIAVIRMPEVVSPLEICGFTMVSRYEQRRIMAEWRQTSDVA
jgi:hypothetical protein